MAPQRGPARYRDEWEDAGYTWEDYSNDEPQSYQRPQDYRYQQPPQGNRQQGYRQERQDMRYQQQQEYRQEQMAYQSQQTSQRPMQRKQVAQNNHYGAQSRIPRPQAAAAPSPPSAARPVMSPQWPLTSGAAAPTTPTLEEPESYQPALPKGRRAPQRPQRPSQAAPIPESAPVQEPEPIAYKPQHASSQYSKDPPEPQSASKESFVSRPSMSSVGSIPDFPVPAAPPSGIPAPTTPSGPPRRSVNLGPPPSSRRGASSFYSNASYVSPIPEESPRTRSHASYASSAAMPESWVGSPVGYVGGGKDAFYDEIIPEEGRESVYEDEADDSALVRKASVGKISKPALVLTASQGQFGGRPGPQPMQSNAFTNGTALLGPSSSSDTLPTSKSVTPNVTSDNLLAAQDAAAAYDAARKMAQPSPRPYSRLSAIRRPPKLDIDAVRKAEARGSLTSLPDLIRRATKLASMIDKGRRPASRMGLDDFPDDVYGKDKEDMTPEGEKRQSGLSDMLAAFPNPGQRRSGARNTMRQSTTSWPLPLKQGPITTLPALKDRRKPRRCCGLPVYVFVIVIIVILIVIAAAIFIPLEFFVFRKTIGNASPQPALAACEAQLQCANGGTNVVSQDVCSCICTNGFTGSTCSIAGSAGCTTADITSLDANNDSPSSSLSNVTIGAAIPRLIEQANSNFSIPLSGTAILAKLNSASLSCTASNALVTFDGRSSRLNGGNTEVLDLGAQAVGAAAAQLITTITIQPGAVTTITVVFPPATAPQSFVTIVPPPGISTPYTTTMSMIAPQPTQPPPPPTTTAPPPTSPTQGVPSVPVSAADPASTFIVTEDTVDFARVAVLFILQERVLAEAQAASAALQRFFSRASQGSRGVNTAVKVGEARNLTLGNRIVVDLVQFRLDLGSGRVVGKGLAA